MRSNNALIAANSYAARARVSQMHREGSEQRPKTNHPAITWRAREITATVAINHTHTPTPTMRECVRVCMIRDSCDAHTRRQLCAFARPFPWRRTCPQLPAAARILIIRPRLGIIRTGFGVDGRRMTHLKRGIRPKKCARLFNPILIIHLCSDVARQTTHTQTYTQKPAYTTETHNRWPVHGITSLGNSKFYFLRKIVSLV